MRPEASEQRRQKGNIIRLGTVAQVDVAAALCRIQTGELLTDWIPWLVPRAGNTIEWSAPSVGEQGIVLCPDGDTFGAVFLRGVYSNIFNAPASDTNTHLVRFPDGTELRYNAAAHALDVNVASGGTVTVTASGGVTINGDVQINGSAQISGTVTAQEDCIGGGISLKNHIHTGVTAGSATSGAPQ